MIIKDQLQRELRFEKVPQRIVSLVPSQTELLVDLGLEDSIVGVTKFCVHPSHIKRTTTKVGGTKKVNFQKIKDLDPDIILCNKEENTKEMVEELEKIAPVHVSDIIDIGEALELIEQYGILFKKEKNALRLISKIRELLLELEEEIFPSRKVAYLIWRRPWMAAGSNTFINTLLKINGWKNVFGQGTSRYPEIELGDLEKLGTEVLLLSSEPFPFGDKHISEIQKEFNGKIELVDGEYFSWYGSRLIPAIQYFRKFQMKLSNSL